MPTIVPYLPDYKRNRLHQKSNKRHRAKLWVVYNNKLIVYNIPSTNKKDPQLTDRTWKGKRGHDKAQNYTQRINLKYYRSNIYNKHHEQHKPKEIPTPLHRIQKPPYRNRLTNLKTFVIKLDTWNSQKILHNLQKQQKQSRR